MKVLSDWSDNLVVDTKKCDSVPEYMWEAENLLNLTKFNLKLFLNLARIYKITIMQSF